VLAMYGGLWAYSGWDILNYGAEEIERPKRSVTLMGQTFSSSAIYPQFISVIICKNL
jgi:hypothetical protein